MNYITKIRGRRLHYLIRPLLRKAIVSLVASLFVASLFIVLTPQGRATVNTLLFVTQVLPAVPVKVQEFVTAEPTRQEVTYPIANGQGVADLYVPGSGSNHSAVLLFLGVNPAGRDDSRVVRLAESLARTGTIVMIPWSENMTRKRIAVEEIDNLVNAFLYLKNLDMVNPQRVGMAGFCVGASLTAVAAQDERIRSEVRFVNFFGGYFNATDLVKAVVTESRFHGGQSEPWDPDRLSIEVVTTHLIEGLEDFSEREALSRRFIEKSNAEVDFDLLSKEAQAVYRLLDAPTLDEAEALIRQIPIGTRNSLRSISPSTNIDNLEAKVLIMHDREDGLVPSEESRRMAEILTDGQEVYYTEFSLFQHVDPTQPVSPPEFVKEGFKLFLHMYNVMREL